MSSDGSRSLQDAYAARDQRGSSGSQWRSAAPVLLLVAVVAAAVAAGTVLALGPSSGAEVQPAEHDITVDGDADGYADLYAASMPSTVSIYSFGPEGDSQGTGFVYDGKGHIVTNHHVIQNAGGEVYIKYANGEWTTAEVVGADAYTDLAVLMPEERPSYASPLPMADALPSPGERVVALGSPSDLQGSMTAGTVSGVERSMATRSGFSIPDMVQTDAALNPGNSGGPLLSTEGKVVGVNRAKQGENIGFAISSRMTDRVVQSLIESGDHSHPMVGIRTIEMSPTIAHANDMELQTGILVTEAMDDSPAGGHLNGGDGETVTYEGDEYPKGGDLIIALDDRPITNNEELASYLMRQKSPGDEVTFTVIRNGEKMDVTFELGERPPFNAGP